VSDYVAQRLAEVSAEPRQVRRPLRPKSQPRRKEEKQRRTSKPVKLRLRKGFWQWAVDLKLERFLALEVHLLRLRRALKTFRALPLDQLRALPPPYIVGQHPGVYFLWHGPALVYIGKSNNCVARISQHMSNIQFTRYTYLSAPEDLARAFERIYIQIYRPIENVRP
jgi:hypothetical protein